MDYRQKCPANDPAHYKFECFYRPKTNNKASEMASPTSTSTTIIQPIDIENEFFKNKIIKPSSNKSN
jgi:hypothetical protein